MERRRRSRNAVCRRCGTAWTSRSARFCGHCGAPLAPADVSGTSEAEASRDEDAGGRSEVADTHGGADAHAGGGPPSRRKLLGVVLGAAALVVVAVAAMAGDAMWEPDPLAEDPSSVELPEPEDVDNTPESADDGASPPGAQAELDGDCEPVGCGLWRRETRQGLLSFAGDVVVAARSDGSPEVADDHRTHLEGVSLVDGELLWEAEIVFSGAEAGGMGFSSYPLGSGQVVLAAAETVVLLEVSDGGVTWAADLDQGVRFARPIGDEHVLIVGGPVDGAEPGEPDGSETADPRDETSTVLDRATGEVLWSAKGERVVTVARSHAITVDADGVRVLARDLATGEVVWEQEVDVDPQGTVQALGGDRLVVVNGGVLHVLGAADGERLTEVPIDVRGEPQVQVVGDVVLVVDARFGSIEESGQRPAQLIDLQDPSAEPRSLDNLVQAVPILPAAEVNVPWQRPDPTGIALLFQDDERFELRVLDPDGGLRWSIDGGLDEPTCCVQVHAGNSDRLIVFAPGSQIDSPTIVSAEDGSTLATIELPDDLDGVESLRFSGDLAVVQEEGGDGVVLAGDAGYVRVPGASPRYLRPPVPVVVDAAGLLGIDPAMLFSEELQDVAGWRRDG